jgi:signal peptidase I
MTMFPELVSDLLQDGYKVSFIAAGHSHSMYPTILANETLVVEPVGPSDVHKGDIVLYRSNGSLIAHRVIGVVKDDKADEYTSLLKAFCPREARSALESVDGGDGPSPRVDDTRNGLNFRSSNEALFFILRGDASRTFDEPVAPEQVLGKVISIERNGGSLNPYSLRHKLACWAHKWASRIRRNLSLQ